MMYVWDTLESKSPRELNKNKKWTRIMLYTNVIIHAGIVIGAAFVLFYQIPDGYENDFSKCWMMHSTTILNIDFT